MDASQGILIALFTHCFIVIHLIIYVYFKL